MLKWIRISRITVEVIVIGFVITLVGTNIVKASDINQVLIKAADDRRWERVKRIVNEGADVNARDNDGGTALMLASDMGEPDVVKVLIDKGAVVNARDNDGKTALYQASRYGYDQVVNLLKAHGAKE